jgi:glucose-6-phosphate 1-dehydrogenase
MLVGRVNAMAAPQSDALVFFGASGDLARRQIFPALQALARDGRLDMPVVGVARSPWNDDDLRQHARRSIAEHDRIDEAAFGRLAARLTYVSGDYSDPGTYERLSGALQGANHPLHYLAIPPSAFTTVVEALAKHGCTRGARVVVEKPFGRDLRSARALNHALHAAFAEDAIFRIDHYLGKEPVQNLLYFRFANRFLEPVWNRDHLCRIEITLAESFGIAGRGAFYDETGCIRDVVQNHLLQVLSLLAMDAPVDSGSAALRAEKLRLLTAIAPLTPGEVVRGQFAGYRDVDGVARDSDTETYAALRLRIDTWRWAGVEFLIRAGKRLPTTCCEVLATFKQPPQAVFAEDPACANTLRLRLSPQVVIALCARAKKPGARMLGESVELVAYENPARNAPPYARLLGDALRGDATLFTSDAAVEAAWRVVVPVLGSAAPLHRYAPGSWGPAAADELLGAGLAWHDPQQAQPSRRTA